MVKMKNKYISFIMPIYNTASKYLEKSINSVLSQKNPDYELIIIDDGSNEDTKEFLKKYEENEKIKIIHQTNSGVSAARNNGILNSLGEWIAFIDADDWISEEYVDVILKKSINADIIMFNYNEDHITSLNNKRISLNEGIIDEYTLKKIRPSFIHKLYLDNKKQDYAIETIWNKVYKRSLIDSNHLFDEKLKKGEDRIFNLKIFNDNDCKVMYIEDFLYNYLINEESESNAYSENIIQKTEETLGCMRKYLNSREFDKEFYEILDVHIATRIYSYLRLYYLNEKSGKTNKEIKKDLNLLHKSETYCQALKKVKFNKLNLTEKIFLIFFKCNVYDICILLSRLKMKK